MHDRHLTLRHGAAGEIEHAALSRLPLDQLDCRKWLFCELCDGGCRNPTDGQGSAVLTRLEFRDTGFVGVDVGGLDVVKGDQEV